MQSAIDSAGPLGSFRRMGQRSVAIVNPRSAGGATGRGWPRLHQRLVQALGDVDVIFTDRPNAATFLTQQALESGATTIVSVGGDGTHNEVVNGFFREDRPLSTTAALGIVPAGTGGDLRRSFGWSAEPREAIARIQRGERRRVDVGKLSFTDNAGLSAVRYFLNIASFGISGEVDARANRSSKRLGGKLSFALASLRALASYTDRRVRLSLDDGPPTELDITTVAVCNGQYFGGGMWVAPTAKLDDGLFDLTVWSGFGLSDFVLRSQHLYEGTHVNLRETTTARAKRVRAESDAVVLLDVDGEQPGRLPATFEILPLALWVCV